MEDEEGERGNGNKNKNEDEDGTECRPSDYHHIFILLFITIVISASDFHDIIIGNKT